MVNEIHSNSIRWAPIEVVVVEVALYLFLELNIIQGNLLSYIETVFDRNKRDEFKFYKHFSEVQLEPDIISSG